MIEKRTKIYTETVMLEKPYIIRKPFFLKGQNISKGIFYQMAPPKNELKLIKIDHQEQ
jgi:hypothetical protein